MAEVGKDSKFPINNANANDEKVAKKEFPSNMPQINLSNNNRAKQPDPLIKNPINRMLNGGKPQIRQPKSSRMNQKRVTSQNYKNPPKSSRGRKDIHQKDLSPITNEVLMNPLAMPKDEKDLKIVLKELENLHSFHVESQNYPEAEGIQRLIQSAKKKYKFALSNPPEAESSVLKHKELQQVVQKILTQWNEKFDDFLETTETEYSSLISKHEQELNEFDQNAPEELTPQYRKRSVALLELRNKELALAKDKQFAAAQTLKNKNDQIENKEALRQFEKMQNDFLKKRERLISKQEEQIRVFMSHADSVRSNLLQSRANMLEGYLKRMNKLNNEIENMVENKKLKYDDIDTIILPIDRVMKIEETETDSAPIPTLRQETFTSIRQQIRRKQQLREEKAKKALTQKQTEQPVPPAPFVTTSELEQFKEYREIKEEETEETKTVEEETETVEEETEKEPVEEEEKEEEKVEEEEEQNEEDKIEELPQEENEMELYTRKDVADITFFTSTIATFANDTRDNINEKFAEREREETNDEANTKANDETNDGINTEANDETKNEKIDEMNKKVNKTNEENHNISSNSEKLEDDKKADHETDNEKNAEN